METLKPSIAAGYQSVLTQTVGPAAMDVEAYCSIKDPGEVETSDGWNQPEIWALLMFFGS